MSIAIQLALSGINICSSTIVALRYWWAPYVYIFKEVCWLAYYTATEQYGLLPLVFVSLGIGILMYYQWKMPLDGAIK